MKNETARPRHVTHCVYALVLSAAVGFLSACSDDGVNTEVQSQVVQPALADPVLAVVGGSEIRNSQLTVLIQRLAEPAQQHIDDDVRKTLIESLVRMRAVAVEAASQLSEQEKRLIDAKVQAFRDELLAQEYLKRNVTPTPVTHEMVVKYYNDNLEAFTEQGSVRFQYLSVEKNKLDEAGRSKVLSALGAAKFDEDWQALAAKLNKAGLPVEFKAAKMKPAQIKAPLADKIAALSSGKVSDLIFGDQIMVAKVIEHEAGRVTPLTAVSAKIRKMLAPMQLKAALGGVTEQVMNKTKIEYMNGG